MQRFADAAVGPDSSSLSVPLPAKTDVASGPNISGEESERQTGSSETGSSETGSSETSHTPTGTGYGSSEQTWRWKASHASHSAEKLVIMLEKIVFETDEVNAGI